MSEVQSFLAEIKDAEKIRKKKRREEKKIHIVADAIRNASSEKIATSISLRSYRLIPCQSLLAILIPVKKIPDYIIQMIFEELLQMGDSETIKKSLVLFATYRYELLEKIAHQMYALIENEDIIYSLLIEPSET